MKDAPLFRQTDSSRGPISLISAQATEPAPSRPENSPRRKDAPEARAPLPERIGPLQVILTAFGVWGLAD